ncbi:Chemotaxis protein methyltransferase [Candidatus Filomicrobium marinum]|uniref:Chemotaxis protein methyltransferase n=2 Tax=Filomicrobium TaxID=119044 RepID=A0A0D6JJS1_9HYPH|nr:Chemotaxis protein methyltransferase [Candidatus Filomicrobium marinum]CPR21927.1 Chemotaxis protein methyltransferase [Candidatus Filomicrobium marinum]SDP48549.1 chemotaxis protein methyltransferase CheR [Filomicrobium insigne]
MLRDPSLSHSPYVSLMELLASSRLSGVVVSQALLLEDPAEEALGYDRLSEANFRRIASLISGKVGIKLPNAKRLMVEGRLRKRMRTLGHPSLTAYCRFLFDQNGLATELVHVIDAVTTNKTDFFREPEHFKVLENKLLPSLLARRPRGGRPRLKFWSAASSNGAEAYTIAMVMANLAEQTKAFDFAVLGTDISTRILAAADLAVYPAEMVVPVPPEFQERYLMRGRSPSHTRDVRMVPELRRRVQFRKLNLMDDRYSIDRDVDVIFLRNVLIYFEKATQEAVVRRLMGHLRPGGFIILGHSESMIGTNMSLRQWAPGVFQYDA